MTTNGRKLAERTQLLKIDRALKGVARHALIWIGSPVIGLRPMRAARFPDLQNSKLSDFHPLAFFQVLGNHADEACQHLLTLPDLVIDEKRRHCRAQRKTATNIGVLFQ